MNHYICDLRHSQIVYNISERERERKILHGGLLTLEMTEKNCCFVSSYINIINGIVVLVVVTNKIMRINSYYNFIVILVC